MRQWIRWGAASFLAVILTVTSVEFVSAASDNEGIEEITVVSRKREEKLQDVPISVSAFTLSDIRDVGMSNVVSLSEMTPNLMIQPTTGGLDATAPCMRAMCRTEFGITEDPMVGVYLNGVYIGKSVGSLFEMPDLEQVEVLHGPQGTLYGKNTLGGAILLRTRRPSGEYGGEITLTGGNYRKQDIRASIEFPITDRLAGLVTVLKKRHDGTVENTLNFPDRDSENMKAIHTALAWNPTDNLTVDYDFDFTQKRNRPIASQMVFVHPNYVFFHDTIAGITPPIQSYITAGAKERDDHRPMWGDAQIFSKTMGHALNVTWDIGDLGFIQDFQIKSISGFRSIKERDQNENGGGTTVPVMHTWGTYDLASTSQELQFNGRAFDGVIDFVTGLFFYHENGEWDTAMIQDLGTWLNGVTRIRNKSYAGFADITWHVTDQFSSSFGLRYTKEKKEASHRNIQPFGIAAFGLTPAPVGMAPFDFYGVASIPGAFPGNPTLSGQPDRWNTKGLKESLETKDLSPRLILNYQWNENLMSYITYSKGFKSGGFPARPANPSEWKTFDDAEIQNYEAGIKSTFWDNRAKLNVTGFLMNGKDLQVQISKNIGGAFSTIIENAGKATIFGLELEHEIRPVTGLNIRASLGITNARYKKYLTDLGSGPVDVAHDRAFEFTPKYSWSVSARYEFPELQIGVPSVRVDYSGQSLTRFFPPKGNFNDVIAQPTYSLWNARISLDDIHVGNSPGTYSFSVWGRNLLDEEYKIGGWSGGDAPFFYQSQFGPPRTVGADLTFRWGSRS